MALQSSAPITLLLKFKVKLHGKKVIFLLTVRPEKYNMLCIMDFSAKYTCKEWLSESPQRFCRLQLVWPFNNTCPCSTLTERLHPSVFVVVVAPRWVNSETGVCEDPSRSAAATTTHHVTMSNWNHIVFLILVFDTDINWSGATWPADWIITGVRGVHN